MIDTRWPRRTCAGHSDWGGRHRRAFGDPSTWVVTARHWVECWSSAAGSTGQREVSRHGAAVEGLPRCQVWETFGDFAYTMKARMEVLRVQGAALAPLSAFLLLQGVETLHLRMERHCQNARRVAEFPAVASARRLGQLARPALEPLLRPGTQVLPARRRRTRSVGRVDVRIRGGSRPARSSSTRCSSCRTWRTSATPSRW